MRAAAAALALLFALTGLTAAAQADRDRALKIYKRGKKAYKAEKFDKAIKLFEKAYAEDPAAAYLFNIAQAHRKLDHCEEALRFYKQFLKEAPEAGAAPAVEERIAELETECGSEESEEEEGDPPELVESGSESESGSQSGSDSASASALESGSESGSVSDSGTGRGVGSSTGTGGGVETGVDLTEPTPMLVATAEAGAAFFDIGDVILPVSATLRIGAAYPLRVGPVTLEGGALAELSTMPYEEASGDSTALLSTLLVNVGATIPLVDKIRVGGEAGAGVLFFSGLEPGNPFVDGAMESSAMSSFALRIGASAEYELFRGLAVSLAPGFVYAGAPGELRDAISSITRFEILGGVRYRL